MPPRIPGGRPGWRRPRHGFFSFVLAIVALAFAGLAPPGTPAEEPADPESTEEQPALEEGSSVPAEEKKLGPPPAAGTTSVTQNLQGNSGIAIQTMCTNCNSADLTVGIPMLGTGDSLNVSTSAAVLLFEAVRQRSSRKADTP